MPGEEDPIRKAIEEGQFDNLPGKGKPLNLDENPYADPEWRLAHHMLQNAGYTLPWIELRQEIEAEIEAARRELQLAWELQALVEQMEAAAGWQRAIARFEEQAAVINRKIRDYNLQTPNLYFQMRWLNASAEIAGIKE